MPSSCSTSSMRRSVGSHSLSPSGSSISKMLLWPCRRRTMFPPRGLLPLALRDSRRPESLPVHLRQFPQQGLQFLPDRYPTAHRLSQRLWHVISRGGARRSPKTHVEMRPMLLALLAAAAGSAAGAIGFGRVPNRARRASWERRRKRASRVALFFITDDIDYALPPKPARRQAQNEAFAHFSARTCLENTALPPSFLHRKVASSLTTSYCGAWVFAIRDILYAGGAVSCTQRTAFTFAACQEYAQLMITEQDIVEHAMRQARRAFWTKVLVAVATASLLVYVALR